MYASNQKHVSRQTKLDKKGAACCISDSINSRFPSLKLRKVFRSEFRQIVGLPDEAITHSLVESWDLWQGRVISYSKMEMANRKQVKDLVKQVDKAVNDDVKGATTLQILCELLRPKAKKENLVHFAENSDDISAVGEKIQLNAPYMLVCISAEEVSFHIMVERETLSEVSNYRSALIHLLGAYFVYDIAYPKAWYSTLILIQVFGLADKQRVPANVIEIGTSLQRMDSTVC